MLFSLTGFESAAVVANVTDDAATTVPRATIYGTGFTGLIYLAATVAALFLLPSAIAANSSAPFADAIAPILGPGAGAIVAIIAAISAFGTCNALLLLSAEVGRSLAVAGDLPPLFRRTNAAGAPTGSILVGAGVATLLVLASSTESFVHGLRLHRARLDRRQPRALCGVRRGRAQAEGDGRRDGRCAAGPALRASPCSSAPVSKRLCGASASRSSACRSAGCRGASVPLRPALVRCPLQPRLGNKPPQFLRERCAGTLRSSRAARRRRTGLPSPPAPARSAPCPRH